mgnify:FL=1
MEDMESLINLKELLDNLCINFGGEELFLTEPSIDKLPRPPEVIKKDINKAKNGFEARTLNKELDNSYKYYST